MERLVTIATFDYPSKADAAKLILEQEGIRGFLADDNLVGMDWLLSNAVGGAKLQVAASDVEQAMEILERHRESNTATHENNCTEDVAFTCEECGKSITFSGALRGRVEMCPKCGSYVDVPEIEE